MKTASKILLAGISFACLALVFAGCQTSSAQKSTGVELFNGKNFSGWAFFMRSNSAPDKTWSITNGLIHCAGRPNGFMRTEKSYSNYVCTVEWRFIRPGNTGVLVDMKLP